MYRDECRMGEKGLLRSLGSGQVKPRAQEDKDEAALGGDDQPTDVGEELNLRLRRMEIKLT